MVLLLFLFEPIDNVLSQLTMNNEQWTKGGWGHIYGCSSSKLIVNWIDNFCQGQSLKVFETFRLWISHQEKRTSYLYYTRNIKKPLIFLTRHPRKQFCKVAKERVASWATLLLCSFVTLFPCYFAPLLLCYLASPFLALMFAPFKNTVTVMTIILWYQQKLPKQGHEFGLGRATEGAQRMIGEFGWFCVNQVFEFGHIAINSFLVGLDGLDTFSTVIRN